MLEKFLICWTNSNLADKFRNVDKFIKMQKNLLKCTQNLKKHLPTLQSPPSKFFPKGREVDEDVLAPCPPHLSLSSSLRSLCVSLLSLLFNLFFALLSYPLFSCLSPSRFSFFYSFYSFLFSFALLLSQITKSSSRML